MFSQLAGGNVEDFSLAKCAEYYKKEGDLVRVVLGLITGGKSKNLLVETFALGILLNARSQKCSSLQKLISFVLRQGGCDKKVFSYFKL